MLCVISVTGNAAADQNLFQIGAEKPVAKRTAARIAHRVILRELPVTGRREKFLVTVRENLKANRVERPHLALGCLVLALHGLQTANRGKEVQFFIDMGSNPRKKQDSRRQILSDSRPGENQTGQREHGPLHSFASSTSYAIIMPLARANFRFDFPSSNNQAASRLPFDIDIMVRDVAWVLRSTGLEHSSFCPAGETALAGRDIRGPGLRRANLLLLRGARQLLLECF